MCEKCTDVYSRKEDPADGGTSIAGRHARARAGGCADLRGGEAGPPVPPAPQGARSASIKAWPLARYRERGEPCEVCSCLTGRTHRISLKEYAHLDPETTLVELIFRFVPVPYTSKEARGIRDRAVRALRREYETLIAWHDDEARLAEDLADWNIRFPERPRTRSNSSSRCTRIARRGRNWPTDWPVGS